MKCSLGISNFLEEISSLSQSVVPCPVLTAVSWPAYRFSRGRSGGLVFPSLSEFSIVYCDPHSQRQSGLKQHKYMSSLFWRSEVQNQSDWAEVKVSERLHLPGGSVERIHFLAFFTMWKTLHSLAHGPFLASLQPLASVTAFPTTDSDSPTYLLYGLLWLYH